MGDKKGGEYTTCAFRLVKRKKGISSVIATVGLLLLTVVVVAVLIVFVVPFVRDNLNESTSCLDYSEYFSFNEKFDKFNCYELKPGNSNQKLYKLSVGAKTAEELIGEQIKGFKLVFYGDDASITKDVSLGDSASKLGGGVYMTYNEEEPIKIPKPGETITYVYVTDKAFSKAEIYVKLKSGKDCSDTSDFIALGVCN